MMAARARFLSMGPNYQPLTLLFASMCPLLCPTLIRFGCAKALVAPPPHLRGRARET